MSVVYRRDVVRGFRVWSKNEIFTGELGTVSDNLYVPNVGDIVYDNKDSFYKVVAVDAVTAIPTLEMINPSSYFSTEITDPDDLIHGLGYYQPHASNRAFVDNIYSPAVVSIDSRYRIYGSESTQAKLFLGSDTSDTGRVISQSINSSGVVLSEMIDLEPIYDSNNTIFRPKRFHTTVPLEDGERVTLVVYNAGGRVCGVHPFIIRNANAISGPAASDVYIEDIELVSDLLSNTDPMLLENPINVPFTTTMLACRVHYSNGTTALHSVDGNRVKIHGITSFNTSLLGPVARLVLSYYTAPGEPAINLQGLVEPSISKTYRIANVPVLDAFAVKLNVIPVWDGSGYTLNFILTNIEFTDYIDVTEHVTLALADGGSYRPNLFDVEQDIRATLDLAHATSPIDGIHVQQFRMTLEAPAGEESNNWVIDYGSDGMTVFGAGHFAKASQLATKPFVIDCGILGLDNWLSWMYSALDPIFNRDIAPEPPIPTHFRLEHDGQEIGTYPVESWGNVFTLGVDREWSQGKPIVIAWLAVVNGVTKTLAAAPLSIKYTYVPG